MIRVLGVDPGLTGAITLLSDKDLEVWDIPTFELLKNKKKRNELDMHGLGKILSDLRPFASKAYVEEVHAMTKKGVKQGVTSMFSFGWVCGAIRQALVDRDFAIEMVSPRKWQLALGVKKGSDGSLLRASELLPSYADKWSRKMDHNRAAASLIAYYGLHQQANKAIVRPTRRRLRLKVSPY